VPPLGFAWALPFQPPLIPHFLFNRLTLGGIEAAATIGGAVDAVPPPWRLALSVALTAQ